MQKTLVYFFFWLALAVNSFAQTPLLVYTSESISVMPRERTRCEIFADHRRHTTTLGDITVSQMKPHTLSEEQVKKLIVSAQDERVSHTVCFAASPSSEWVALNSYGDKVQLLEHSPGRETSRNGNATRALLRLMEILCK